MWEYFDIVIEILVDNCFFDIVVERFDFGIWFKESLVKDMIVQLILGLFRMIVVVSLKYLKKNGILCMSKDFVDYNCINICLFIYGGFYVWEFEQDGQEFSIWVFG